jgi:hypothetical protein
MMVTTELPYWMGADGVAYYPGTITESGEAVDCQPGILWAAGMVRVKTGAVPNAIRHGWRHLADEADGWSVISRRGPVDGYHGRRIA